MGVVVGDVTMATGWYGYDLWVVLLYGCCTYG